MNRLTILCGDALEKLRELPAGSVHCCVTSPPYWGLRDYGVAGQIGLEPTPEEYVARLVEVFREVKRVLRDDGTLWLNLGDSYNGYMANQRGTGLEIERQQARKYVEPGFGMRDKSLKNKDLVGIPWRVAFALQEDGWYLRADIIWHKQNCMPESVTDRPTKNHEYLFLLTKSARYFYDAQAIMEPCSQNTHLRISQNLADQVGSERANGGAKTNGNMKAVFRKGKTGAAGHRVKNNESFAAGTCLPVIQRNKRTVWSIPSAAYSEAHFATYPPKLVEPCILAGTSAKGCCPQCGAPWERVTEEIKPTEQRYGDRSRTCHPGREGKGIQKRAAEIPEVNQTTGWQPTCECSSQTPDPKPKTPPLPCTVLDPFAGSGTTGQVALEHGRRAILIELNPKYIPLMERRTNVTPGLALA